MIIGVPKEIKNHESRVGLTDRGAGALVAAGHEVVVEAGAGLGAAISDDDYRAAGARIGTVDDAWGADLVVKVKEPVPAEYGYLRSDQILFAFLHLAADAPLAAALTAAGTTALSYDTVQLADGSLPLLAPMSEVAGSLAALVGAYYLMGSQGGRGVLLGGVPGVAPGKVVVLGGGIAGSRALEQVVAMGADCTVIDLSVERLRALDEKYGGHVRTVVSTPAAIDTHLRDADLVIGAVLIPGHRAPRLVSHDQVKRMKRGSVLVDIAIDQGGCFEDSHPTTHDDPVFHVEGSLFYCVANMPGAVGSTSTRALTNVTLPYVHAIARSGWAEAIAEDPALAAGLMTSGGRLRHPAVVEAFPDWPAAPAS